MKNITILFLLALLSTFAVGQQDPQFSHNMFNQLTINPGAAGVNGRRIVNTTLIRRDQWVGIDFGSGFKGAPKTTLATIDGCIKMFGVLNGVSLTVLSDQLGFFNDTWIKLGYAYKKPFKSGTLSIGLDFGIYNKSLSGASWEFPSSTSEVIVTEGGRIGFDLGAGVYYNTKKMYLGLSSTHIPQTEISLEQKGITGSTDISMKRHYYAIGGYKTQISEPRIELMPSFMVKSDLKAMQFSINMNAMFNKRFWGGVTYRNLESVILLAGVELKSGIKFGYAYDITTTRMHYGSHEVMINYNFYLDLIKPPKKYKSVRFL